MVLGVSSPRGRGQVDARRPRGRSPWRARTSRGHPLHRRRLSPPRRAARAGRAAPGQPLPRRAGAPGTHDVTLGATLLDDLRGGGAVTLPAYDKGAFDGEGDRAPRSRWREVCGPFDVVLFEGWMLGFSPSPRLDRAPHLAAVNGYLRGYEAWTSRLDGLLHLDVDDLELVVRWRVESEQRRRAVEGAGSATRAPRRTSAAFSALSRVPPGAPRGGSARAPDAAGDAGRRPTPARLTAVREAARCQRRRGSRPLFSPLGRGEVAIDEVPQQPDGPEGPHGEVPGPGRSPRARASRATTVLATVIAITRSRNTCAPQGSRSTG